MPLTAWRACSGPCAGVLAVGRDAPLADADPRRHVDVALVLELRHRAPAAGAAGVAGHEHQVVLDFTPFALQRIQCSGWAGWPFS